MTIIQDLYNIVNSSLSNSETVIFQQSLYGSNVRPQKPYVTMKVLSINQLGMEENINLHTITDDLLDSAQVTNSSVIINVQYISDAPDAVFKLDDFKAKIQSNTMNEYMNTLDSDIGYMSAEGVIDVSALILDAFENRASVDITFNLSMTRQEKISFIETIIYDTIVIEDNKIT